MLDVKLSEKVKKYVDVLVNETTHDRIPCTLPNPRLNLNKMLSQTELISEMKNIDTEPFQTKMYTPLQYLLEYHRKNSQS